MDFSADHPIDITDSTILVVDDNPTNLKVIVDFLEEQNFTVLVSRNGESALKRASYAQPDLILLDVLMPGIDGFETCRRLKSMDTTLAIPVVFMSALTEIDDKSKGFQAGAVDFITKPVHQQELYSRVIVHLQMQALKRQLRLISSEVASSEAHPTPNPEQPSSFAPTPHPRTANIPPADSPNHSQKNVLATSMGHALQTQLHSILGLSELLKHCPNLSPEANQYISGIHHHSQQLQTQIVQALHFAHLEVGQGRVNPVDFNLYLLLDDVTNHFRLQAECRELQILLERGVNLPRYVQADGYKLRQILINLLDNGLKFTSVGGVALRVAIAPTAESQQPSSPLPGSTVKLQFTIEDTGMGIALEQIEQIFDPFVQLSTTGGQPQGVGLGLTLSRHYATMMGGQLTVHSQPEQGSIFQLHLPLLVVKEALTQTKLRPGQVRELEPNQPYYRILIIEPQETHRLFLQQHLEILALDIKACADQTTALELCQHWQPHLIWVDIQSPVAKNADIVEQFQSQLSRENTIIIGTSASILDDQRSQVLAKGFDDFVPKPFSETCVSQKLTQHLGLRYIYENRNQSIAQAPEVATTDIKLRAQDFRGMTNAWLQDMLNATLSRDQSLMRKLIDQIEVERQFLAFQLTHLIEHQAYDIIVKLLLSVIS